MGRVKNELRQRKIVRDGTQISFCHIFAHSDSERPPTESKAGDHKTTLFTHDLSRPFAHCNRGATGARHVVMSSGYVIMSSLILLGGKTRDTGFSFCPFARHTIQY